MVFSLGIFLAPFTRARAVKKKIIKSGNANFKNKKVCF